MRIRLRLPWQFWLAATALAVVNALLLVEAVAFVILWPHEVNDWWLIKEAHARSGTGRVYEWSASSYLESGAEYVYRYSPLLPPFMGPFLEAGIHVWRLAHFAILVALPAPVAFLTLFLGPFWFDVAHANFITFAVVFAWNAVAGQRWAQASYFALLILIPRPLMIPVAAWLILRRPESRPIALAIIIGGLSMTLGTGEFFNWIGAVSNASDMIGTKFDWGPSRFFGLWWWPVGLIVGTWLTLHGRLGLASLAVSPYILPYYLLFVALELRHTRLGRTATLGAWLRDRTFAKLPKRSADPAVT